jgi:hypothetical protein
MTEFFQTMMGQKFYQGDIPRIADALEKIAKELKRQNDLKEKEVSDKGEVEPKKD